MMTSEIDSGGTSDDGDNNSTEGHRVYAEQAARLIGKFFAGTLTDGEEYDKLSYEQFQAMFPSKYRASQHVRWLYSEYQRHRQQVRAQVTEHAHEYFCAAASKEATLGDGGSEEVADNELDALERESAELEQRHRQARAFLTAFVRQQQEQHNQASSVVDEHRGSAKSASIASNVEHKLDTLAALVQCDSTYVSCTQTTHQ